MISRGYVLRSWNKNSTSIIENHLLEGWCVYDFVNLLATSIDDLNSRSWNPSHTRCSGNILRNHTFDTMPRRITEDSTRLMCIILNFLSCSFIVLSMPGMVINRWRVDEHRHSYQSVDRRKIRIHFDVETVFRPSLTFFQTIVWRSLAHRVSLLQQS